MADVHEAAKAMSPDIALKLVASLYVLGDKYGSPSDTLAMLDFMLVALPDNPALVAAKARVHLLSFKYSDAIYLLEKNLEIHPGNPMVTAMLALTLYAHKDRRWESTLNEVVEFGDDVIVSNIVKELSERSGIEFRTTQSSAADDQFPHTYGQTGMFC